MLLTRWPIARYGPIETDEFGYLEIIKRFAIPPHHSLYLASGRILGDLAGNAYDGFVILSMLMSICAILAAWWMLRAIVEPNIAAAATATLAFGPIFWSYGSIAGSYTAIAAVGCVLLGTALRPPDMLRLWVTTVIFVIGIGFRQDIGVLWLPMYAWILTRYRFREALGAFTGFVLLNLLWLGAMIWSVGGINNYWVQTRAFAQSAGYGNSVFNLGFLDGTLRYAVKLAVANLWETGIAILFVPAGIWAAWNRSRGKIFWLAALSMLPALVFHLTIHFGVAGYCMHYVPAILVLIALGCSQAATTKAATAKLAFAACISTVIFMSYPADFGSQNPRAEFDKAIARYTRVGLRLEYPRTGVQLWRTANSPKIDDKPIKPMTDG